MEGLQLVAILGAALLVVSIIARRSGVPLAVLLLGAGIALGAIPRLRGTPLPPDVVLVLFLPALLYWESLNISLREIRRNLRVIVLNSVFLVGVTTVGVAAAAHAFGLPWPSAFVLGAVVAPTDATAVAAVASRLPRRFQTVLRAESLINDGTALVLYAVAVGVATGKSRPDPGIIAGRLALAYAVGAAVGLAVAALASAARSVDNKPLLQNVVGVVSPFLAYLASGELYGSGVIAVVVCGLAMTRTGARRVTGQARLQGAAFWQLTTFLLNGTLFLLVGLQVYSVTDRLGGIGAATAVRDGLITLGSVVGVRIVWPFVLTPIIRTIDRRPSQRARRTGARQRLALSWAGPRGAVSLAAALAIPATTASGAPFPGRSTIVFCTFVVIAGTLVAQGLTLGPVVRWGRLPTDNAREDEVSLSERTMGAAVRDQLPDVAKRLQSPDIVVSQLEHMYAEMHDDTAEDLRELRLAMLGVKRDAVVQLRDDGRIDDIVLQQVLTHLDREESALLRDDG